MVQVLDCPKSMPILIILLIYLHAWSSPSAADPEIKKLTQLFKEQIQKTNQAAKNNRKLLKEAYRHPRVTASDIKQLQKAEAANLKLLEETEKILKNQKH